MNPLKASASLMGRSPCGAITIESMERVGGGHAETIKTSPLLGTAGDCERVFTLYGRSTVSRAPRMVTRQCAVFARHDSGASHVAPGPGLDVDASARGAGVARHAMAIPSTATMAGLDIGGISFGVAQFIPAGVRRLFRRLHDSVRLSDDRLQTLVGTPLSNSGWRGLLPFERFTL